LHRAKAALVELAELRAMWVQQPDVGGVDLLLQQLPLGRMAKAGMRFTQCVVRPKEARLDKQLLDLRPIHSLQRLHHEVAMRMFDTHKPLLSSCSERWLWLRLRLRLRSRRTLARREECRGRLYAKRTIGFLRTVVRTIVPVAFP